MSEDNSGFEDEAPHIESDTSVSKPLDEDVFEKYTNKIFELRPNLKQISDENQDVDLYSYNKKQIRENRNPIIRQRKLQLIAVLEERTRQVLGSEIAASVAKQLKGNDSVSTTQHSAPLNEVVLKYGMQNALPYFNTDHPNLQNVIILACALVSFNNSSSPKDLLLHSSKNKQLLRLPLFGRSVDSQSVIYSPPYDHEAIKQVLIDAQKLRSSGDLDSDQYQRLIEIIKNIYGSPHALSADSYHDQITITNYYSFKDMFSKSLKNPPNFIFLSQEEIVTNLLLQFHLEEKTTLHNIIFNSKVREFFESKFNSLDGAFSIEDKKGTFLFWHIPKDRSSRRQLWRKGDYLISDDGEYKLELTPEAVATALKNQEIVPSVMLTFIVLSFYYGLFLTGGFRQTYVLGILLSAYNQLLEEIGDTESKEAAQDLITTNIIVQSSLLYRQYSDNRIPATALDIQINPQKQINWNDLLNSYKKVPYSEIIKKTFPTVYQRFCPPQDQQEVFLKISEAQIDELMNFESMVPSAVKQ